MNLALDAWLAPHLADRIVFVANEIKKGKMRLARRIPSDVIYNGVTALANGDGFSLPEEMKSTSFRIGVVGRLTEVKGHIYLLKAMETLRDLPITLFIVGEGHLEAELKDYCRARRLAGRVRFMGFRQAIQDYIRGLNLLVMPSVHEGFPYTLLEAASLKIPFIASEVGGVREIFTSGLDCLLVPPRDPLKLAEAIRSLYADKNLRTELAGRAEQSVRERFLVGPMTERYCRVYDDLLREKKGAGIASKN
jgi:glycosyltransferase involved in cell wall biosynthesis